MGLRIGYRWLHIPSFKYKGYRYPKLSYSSPYVSLVLYLIGRWFGSFRVYPPPHLSASVSFSDPEGNSDGVLNPGEEGEIIVLLKNTGRGPAKKVKLVPEIRGEGSDRVKLKGKFYIKEIWPGVEVISVPIVADEDIPPGRLEVRLSGKDRLGNPVSTEPLYIVVRQLQPPYLSAELELDDSESQWANGMLDGGEEAKLIVAVSNSGEGNGYVTLRCSSSGVSVSIPEEVEVGIVRPGEEKRVEVPVKVPLRAESGTVTVCVVPKERSGFDGPKVYGTFRVRALDMPSLRVANVRIEDGREGLARGNGNGLAENGETVQLSVLVENVGAGDALGVRLDMTSVNPSLEVVKGSDVIGFLRPKRRAEGKLALSIPKTFEADEIKVHLRVSDSRGIGGSERTFRFPYHLRRPVIALHHRIYDGQSEHSRGNRNGRIDKGEVIELELTLENRGDFDAEDLRLEVSTPKERVVLQRKEVVVGRLPSGSSSEPLVIPFTVQRAASSGELPIKVRVSQADFPSFSRTISLRIEEEAGTSPPPVPSVGPEVRPVKAPPVIVVASPRDNQEVSEDEVVLSGSVADDRGIDLVEIWLNGQLLKGRGIKVMPRDPRHREFQAVLPLKGGRNTIRVVAYDTDDLSSERTLVVFRSEERPEFWAVVVGISKYRNVPDLKYADEDARAFYRYLVRNLGVPEDHIWALYDEQATSRSMRSVLGTKLMRKAKKNDTVIIYYAGHGAPEPDATDPDGDGLEKYILPYDADPEDLYSTAIPMREIQTIFRRIKSDRLVLIADACYSGASGGRTIPGMHRAVLSDGFLERISQGKGRVILTASDVNELSREDDRLGHGVFTYYLLRGLRGEADYDHDGLITVGEVYRYVSIKVPQATGNSQNPVKKGIEVGKIVLGKVRR